MKNTAYSLREGFSAVVVIALAVFVMAALAGGFLFIAKNSGPQSTVTVTPAVTESPTPTATPTATPVVGAGAEDATLDRDLVNLDSLLGKVSDSVSSADTGLKDKVGDLAE